MSYDQLARVYDELYSGEQVAKIQVALELQPPLEPVLDVGCGTGLLLSLLDCYAVGLDLSAGMLKVAKSRVVRGDLVRGDAARMPFRDRCFRTIYSVTVVHEAPSMVDEVLRVLKEGSGGVLTLLKKRLELLPSILARLPHSQVLDFGGLKDMFIVFWKTASNS
ncbi:MAG: class I SAM-dependent methyltransferase [Desulfurococcaceae archaeon]